MINKLKLFVLVTLLLSTLTVTNWSCEKLFGGDEEISDIYLNTNQYNPIPFEIITLWSDEGLPQENEFTGTFGELEINAVQSEPGLLYFMIPDVPPGTYTVTLDLGDYKAIIDLTVEASTSLNNPEEVLSNIISETNQSIEYLQNIENATGQQIGEQDKLLLTNIISELNTVYATLSVNEKQQFANFIVANPALFGNDTTKSVASGELLAGFKDYMSENMIKVMLAGSTFYLSFTAPEPTGLTKIIALAAGVYLVKKVIGLKMHILEIYTKSVVVEQSDLTVGKSDLVFLNHEEIMFDVKVAYRTMYKEDVNSTIPLLQEVISLIVTYRDYWDKVDGYIIEFKSLFNIGGGGLSGVPKRVSEIETYTSEQVDGNGDLVELIDITNSYVKVAIIDRAEGFIVARFSTCENEYQNFGFTYYYNDPMVTNKNYEALLIATEIIYNEVADPRDGKTYNTIDVGNQTWFAENLNYFGEDGNLGKCDSNDLNGDLYGRYYHFYDAKDEACPPGWHLPSDDEWTQLELALGMDPADIDKYDERGESIVLSSILKSCDVGWVEWNTSNKGINSVGFSVIPASHIWHEHSYFIGPYGYRADFWTSSDNTNNYEQAFTRSIHNSHIGIRKRMIEKYNHQLTIRCVKD